MESDDVTIFEKIGEFPIHESARLRRALELRNIRYEIRTETHILPENGEVEAESGGNGSVVQIYVRPEDADVFHAIYQSLCAPADD